ncbi:MAG: DUF4410 domain-containing protein [Candidatus Omnitrophota bacterium]
MKKQIIMVTVFFVVAFIIGFVYPAGAAEISAPTTICILFDNGVNSTLNDRQAKSQERLSDWMDNDLVRVFARYEKSGYQAKRIEKRQDYTPQPNNYLLTVKITEYRPGSKAARIIVGYGAGGVALKIHYELFVDGVKSILSKDDSTYSGREWINAARKLNQNIAKAVIERLGSK